MEKMQYDQKLLNDEKLLNARGGMGMLLLNLLLNLASLAAIIYGVILIADSHEDTLPIWLLLGGGLIYMSIIGPILFSGLKILKPNEALVLTLFGKYYGTLKGAGFYFVNPFVTAVNPAAKSLLNFDMSSLTENASVANASNISNRISSGTYSKKISLKTMTQDNNKQKVNDSLGNPIEIGIVVIWRVVNTAKAIFNVDNYSEYLSIQCDSALRNVVRLYPYDVSADDDEKSLRGSSQEVADKLKVEIQSKMDMAGIEIIEARITHLAYAPEIAAAMLQRQQAAAVIDAKKMIVDGAVGMVEMALDRLRESDVVNLDEERRAAMVCNLLVVLCGNKEAQPIVNSGSIY